ncbi:hypothetical protein ZWY2020_048141 [Hordeum vulgare]|nr:hypothetical protein ZWY2020_048137 [Hordeum vulgare]KAI4996350.1 hypothetical protein ZWY2020_048141 [Hordeum vulgare]
MSGDSSFSTLPTAVVLGFQASFPSRAMCLSCIASSSSSRGDRIAAVGQRRMTPRRLASLWTPAPAQHGEVPHPAPFRTPANALELLTSATSCSSRLEEST